MDLRPPSGRRRRAWRWRWTLAGGRAAARRWAQRWPRCSPPAAWPARPGRPAPFCATRRPTASPRRRWRSAAAESREARCRRSPRTASRRGNEGLPARGRRGRWPATGSRTAWRCPGSPWTWRWRSSRREGRRGRHRCGGMTMRCFFVRRSQWEVQDRLVRGLECHVSGSAFWGRTPSFTLYSLYWHPWGGNTIHCKSLWMKHWNSLTKFCFYWKCKWTI